MWQTVIRDVEVIQQNRNNRYLSPKNSTGSLWATEGHSNKPSQLEGERNFVLICHFSHGIFYPEVSEILFSYNIRLLGKKEKGVENGKKDKFDQ